MATGYGICTVICNGHTPGRIIDILNGGGYGTKFLPQSKKTKKGRKRWILSLVPQGTITVDAGAVQALMRKQSLFSVGITDVSGTFGVRDVCIRHNNLQFIMVSYLKLFRSIYPNGDFQFILKLVLESYK